MKTFMAPPPRVFRFLPPCAAGWERGGADGSAPRKRRRDSTARRERTATGSAVLASVLFHLLVFALWPAVTIPVPDPRAMDEALPLLHLIHVREPEVREPDPPPVVPAAARPVVAPGLPAVTLGDAVRLSPGLDLAAAAPVTPVVVARRPPVPGGKTTPGDVFVRPVALSILTNWRPDVPAGGVETTIRVHTDATGRATGLVELVPRTPSHRLDAEIAARVRALEFQPALEGGQPVAAWAEITLVICPGGVTATSPASPSGIANPCAARVRADAVKADG